MQQGNAPLSDMAPAEPVVIDRAGETAAPPPDRYVLETRLIELGAALTSAQHLFHQLERDFYLACFGRYDE